MTTTAPAEPQTATDSAGFPAWFSHDRFGMFIHWGLYALPARHEWVKNRERITDADYQKYFDHFDPDLFDAADWARRARAAGMKYVVLTTKHHEGFCLWDTALTDYKSTNTPFGRDIVREFVDAVRAEGLRVGFYHSLIDWHHPDFTVDGVHPRRDDSPEEIEAFNEGRDMSRYREYLHGQIEELLTDYGQIDYLFYDFSYRDNDHEDIWGGKGRDEWGAEGLMALTKRLQPGIIVNDRLDIPGDLVTPEQYQPDKPMEVDGVPVPWEACQTLNGSWGYDRDNVNLKPVDLLVRMLVDGVSNNGNMLLNIGPTGRGEFDGVSRQTLDGIGTWMHQHARSVYGAGPSRFVAPRNTVYTQNGNRLYLHLFAWPFEHVHLPDLAGKVAYAQLLNDASEIHFREIPPGTRAQNTGLGGQPAGTLTLTLPIVRPDVAVPVVELFLRD
ncbi:alpha-L-fucosidase [Curtobacterium aurantiacum]|uniref:alpha-L-fucosidase n=1 Tax=Curtobacterium aurantiacum TaxID=3236919 RepID=A0ABS5VF98_9MICO|nr:alpha-L-fucosidase [Curtobacterium flaccumfaciens]MBT1545921.1 alpha-L-fucosidase [Curtobacterium flaccumfaciens pv. flaccumfaciens]MBT1587679.1 alpha-L-fucosidase [Curtobacterium flaccumfaciens pv. flaccumfaciens]